MSEQRGSGGAIEFGVAVGCVLGAWCYSAFGWPTVTVAAVVILLFGARSFAIEYRRSGRNPHGTP